jgi:geranylgeranyl diphosphate synthase type II
MADMIESALKEYMKNSGSPFAQSVYDAMAYSIFGTGKRIRPQLTLMFCRLCGEDEAKALPFACAVEMIHTYSLIHDDLPCMDNDDMRRGRASNHIKFGEDTALLAGDGLLTKAFEVSLSMKTAELVGCERALKAAGILAALAGADGMVGGQCIDLQTEGKEITGDELNDMVMGKTVCLIKAACLMGAVAAGAPDKYLEAAEKYAEGIGMAFQIRDDILDVIGDSKKMGKNVGVDSQNDRRNFVTLYGINRAQELVDAYTEQAVSCLAVFDGDKSELINLALSLAGRES